MERSRSVFPVGMSGSRPPSAVPGAEGDMPVIVTQLLFSIQRRLFCLCRKKNTAICPRFFPCLTAAVRLVAISSSWANGHHPNMSWEQVASAHCEPRKLRASSVQQVSQLWHVHKCTHSYCRHIPCAQNALAALCSQDRPL